MAQCPNCGAGLRPGFPRCMKCGSMVEESPPPATNPAPATGTGERSDHGNVNVNVHIDPSHLAGAGVGDSSHGWSDHPDVPGPGTGPSAPLKPHRAGAILFWAIIGWVVCVVIGPLIAISMANSDLKQMDAGVMDPSGRSNVGTAKVVATIALVLQILGLGLTLLAAAEQGGW